MEFRRQLDYPPLSRLALLTLRGRNEDKVKFASEHVAKEVARALEGEEGLQLRGPAPAPLLRHAEYQRNTISRACDDAPTVDSRSTYSPTATGLPRSSLPEHDTVCMPAATC